LANERPAQSLDSDENSVSSPAELFINAKKFDVLLSFGVELPSLVELRCSSSLFDGRDLGQGSEGG
jgi:hypothetical protein